ncbi:CoA-dependent acyltransferase [Mollisia scopiformis]|uniref:CoA-dependent acyltransferase n=1 Tax=Mollisia scopiformis TaxID=149040 RepID=A0A132B6X1_MOLSC|nr:CoA-dependent acyltransferase [Mollisia scopiformis]KUJ08158.1 CoA-dependent acyltransferase [Mollisia scopiformis]
MATESFVNVLPNFKPFLSSAAHPRQLAASLKKLFIGWSQSHLTAYSEDEIVSLITKAKKHDAGIPNYPLPSIDRLYSEYSAIFDQVQEGLPSGSYDQLRLTHQAFAEAFSAITSQMPVEECTNWHTAIYEHRMLARRCALKETSMAVLLGHASKDQATTAGLALHALAVAYRSPALFSVIGTDGKGKNFEMMQVAHTLATCRIPGSNVDFLKTSPESTYALVWYQNHAYKVDILDSNFRPHSATTIIQQIRYIFLLTAKGRGQNSVCEYSSTLQRQDWAQLRNRLRKTNSRAVEQMEGAITSVALHELCPQDSAKRLVLIREDQSCMYSDQTLGLSVFSDGELAMRFDHAAVDGGAACHFVGFMDYIMKRSSATRGTALVLSPRRIEFFDLEDSRQYVRLPARMPAQRSTTLSVHIDSKLLSSLRKSKLVDTILQLSFQAAILSHKNDGLPLRVMEPVAMRHFSGGRIIPQLVSTPTSHTFCKELIRSDASSDMSAQLLLQELFQHALAEHRRILSDTKQGNTLANNALLLEQCVQLLPQSQQKAAAGMVLRESFTYDASFTGAPFAPHVMSMESALRRDNFIAGCYVGHSDKLVISLIASGTHMAKIEELKMDLERLICEVIDLKRGLA